MTYTPSLPILQAVLRSFVNHLEPKPCGFGSLCCAREVQDSGIGVSQEDMQHMFDRFYRSDPARTRQSGGTGLGLAIARWIVDRHGGHFEVLSREGLGTRMTVCLPAAEKAE